VALECGEAGDRLTPYAEGGNAVRDHLLRIGDDLENRLAQRLERAAFRLLDTAQVLVDLLGGHRLPMYIADGAELFAG